MWNKKVIPDALRCEACDWGLWNTERSTLGVSYEYPLPLTCPECGHDNSKQLMDHLVENAEPAARQSRHKPVNYPVCEKAIADEQDAAVMKLLRRGKSPREIEKDLQLSRECVRRIANRILAELKEDTTKDAAKWVGLCVSRLDAILDAIYDLAVPDKDKDKNTDLIDPELRLKVIDRVLRLEERRAKLLGLDAPAKVAQTDPSGENEYGSRSREDLAARLSSLLGTGRARRDAGDPGRPGGEG